MAVTIQQIAERAGVSRGTVDRALNNRGRINPEVAEKIRKIADEMGYIPKERKKRARGKIRIGVVTQLAKSSFMLEINRGIQQAKEELEDRGIELLIKEGLSVDEEEQLRMIGELAEEGIQGLALMPVDSPRIRNRVDQLAEAEPFPVVTFNSDLAGSKRVCFVGMDNRKSGRTAADEVERIIVNTMRNIPGIDGLFVVSGGQAGIRNAFAKLKTERRPSTIIYDLTPKNKRLLEEDVADFLIDQNGFVQGYEPPHILADILQKNRMPEQEYRYTDINIKTKYNL